MQVDMDHIIPVAKLQKELTGRLRELTNKGEPLFVMRNNSLAAVIISPEEYEILKDAESILEHLELAEMLEKRLRHHDRSQNIPWDRLKADRGL